MSRRTSLNSTGAGRGHTPLTDGVLITSKTTIDAKATSKNKDNNSDTNSIQGSRKLSDSFNSFGFQARPVSRHGSRLKLKDNKNESTSRNGSGPAKSIVLQIPEIHYESPDTSSQKDTESSANKYKVSESKTSTNNLTVSHEADWRPKPKANNSKYSKNVDREKSALKIATVNRQKSGLKTSGLEKQISDLQYTGLEVEFESKDKLRAPSSRSRVNSSKKQNDTKYAVPNKTSQNNAHDNKINVTAKIHPTLTADNAETDPRTSKYEESHAGDDYSSQYSERNFSDIDDDDLFDQLFPGTPRFSDSFSHCEDDVSPRHVSLSPRVASPRVTIGGKKIELDIEEVDDTYFDSDDDEVTQATNTNEDIKTLYSRACKLVGTVPSRRIGKELNGNRIYLDDASLNSSDIKAICIALLGNTTVTRLDLSGNQLDDQASQYISELLAENIFLTHVFCAGCQLQDFGLTTLLNTVTNSKNIAVLDLSDNKLKDEQVEIVATLLKKNPYIRELRLSYCDIDEEGGKILAGALEDTNIEILDLSWNQLRQKGGTSFCLALGENTSLRELDLSWNGLSREGCAGLEQALAKNKYLIQLNLESNRISSLCLGHLLKGLERNKTLETLNLTRNPISIDDAKVLANAFKANTRSAIKVLDLTDVTVDDEFLELQEDLQRSRQISIYYGSILSRPRKEEIQQGPITLASFDPILVLFEYMKQQNLRLIDLFRTLDLNHDNAISREELRSGFKSLNVDLPEGVFSAAFHKLDLNSNNVIDIDELKNAHRRVVRQTASLMQRVKSSDEDDGYGDMLHEFQRLVRAAANKRKTQRPRSGAENDDDPQLVNVVRRLSSLPKGNRGKAGKNNMLSLPMDVPVARRRSSAASIRSVEALGRRRSSVRFRDHSGSSAGSSPNRSPNRSPNLSPNHSPRAEKSKSKS